MVQLKQSSPFTLPIYFFGITILLGSVLLSLPLSTNGRHLSWIDALFTATSATCVTGLIVVDTGSFFSPFGQWVILGLIQLGGLGIMTYTSLVLYLWRQRVSLTDRLAVGQSLLHDPKFNLGQFLLQVLGLTFFIEAIGAGVLYLLDPVNFPPMAAVFHSVSAFCNAGFSLFADSLSGWRDSFGVNVTFMLLIVLGGIGFYVLLEFKEWLFDGLLRRRKIKGLSWRSQVVLKTSGVLVLLGWVLIFLAEYFGQTNGTGVTGYALSSLFQSVTCRTAGFNTVEIGQMTNVSLLLMILLMGIGGSPGSCAGGIKTTTLRVLWAFGRTQLKGRKQTVIQGYAMDEPTMNRALTLAIFAGSIITLATLLLSATEGGDTSHPIAQVRFLDVLFEVVSAFGTVGLSTGLTSKLSFPGKLIIITLMFVGRLGPILFLSVLQSWQVARRFKWSETSLPIG